MRRTVNERDACNRTCTKFRFEATSPSQPMTSVQIIVQSILDSDADIVVISANPALLAGSGISGVIHRAAGAELEKSAKSLAPLKVGEAVITPAFDLNAKYVVHTVCPRYMDGNRGEPQQLASAYASALGFYRQVTNAKSIAFVSMGTGVYRWPLASAAEIAVKELMESEFEETTMCVIDEPTRIIYQAALDKNI